MIPFLVALYYGDGDALSFFITMVLMLPIMIFLCKIRTDKEEIYAKEGFLTVGLAWILISVVGALPFVISGAIPSFIDAFFETSSGFTTTGASILTEIESLPRGILFWRSFTHWIGGMGFLIFILAVIPSLSTNTIFLLKAESPGPNPGKIVPKIRETAKILYMIYFIMTVIETILLMMAGLSLYDALIHALGTAGTGGFSNMNSSVASFNNPAVEWIITIFMLLFGVNFVLYFQMFKGDFKSVFKSEELKYYILMVVVSIVLITINIIDFNGGNIGLSIRESSFQVASVITTTGFATTDFGMWPTLSQILLLLLMVVGACAGSTGGGMKISRIMILIKSAKSSVKKMVSPRSVSTINVEGKPVDKQVLDFAYSYFVVYALIFFASVLLSFENLDIVTTLTAPLTCLGNVGPGFGDLIGPVGNFALLSNFSKIVLSFDMLAGRLELFPMILLCYSIKDFISNSIKETVKR